MIFLTVIFMDLLAGMEFDLFVPSFPELRNHFGLSPFWVEALLSANFIAYCVSLFLVGGLADRYGRKPVILTGLLIFISGSIFCLWASSPAWLLAGRFFQGIGIAAPAILSFIIIADSYPLKQQQFLLAMLNGSMNIATGLAPVIGSYVTLYFHWQGNFAALLFLGVITLLMTLWFIPKSNLLRHHHEHGKAQGYKAIFHSRYLLLLIISMVFMFVPYWIFVGMSPLLYMENLHVSLAQFGFYQGLLALVFALGSLFYGLIMEKCDQKDMLNLSWQIFIVSLITIAGVTFLNGSHPLLITLAFLPFVIGQIIPSALLYPVSLNIIPEAKGRVTAIIGGGRLILSALGLQLAGYFYQGTFRQIGLIILCFIFMAVLLLFLVIKKQR